jgi:hypothetical protein
MTTEQAIEVFKANPDIVPPELSNKLVEDCIDFLKSSKENRFNFNLDSQIKCDFSFVAVWNVSRPPAPYLHFFEKNEDPSINIELDKKSYYNSCLHTLVVLRLLSRRRDGQALMEFLDVETEYRQTINVGTYREDDTLRYTRCDFVEKTTLDKKLYREFTEALRVGKTFDEALAIINHIYLRELYV